MDPPPPIQSFGTCRCICLLSCRMKTVAESVDRNRLHYINDSDRHGVNTPVTTSRQASEANNQ